MNEACQPSPAPTNPMVQAAFAIPVRPRLVEDLAVFPMPDGLGVQIRGAGAPVLLRGGASEAVLAWLLPKLDGRRTVEELRALRPREIEPAAVLRALALLHGRGLLASGPKEDAMRSDPALADQLLFWGRHLGGAAGVGSAAEVQDRLGAARVLLLGTGFFGAATYDLLARSGCRRLRVVAWDDGGLLSEAVSRGPTRAEKRVALETTSIGRAADVVRSWVAGMDLVLTATRNAPTALFAELNRACLSAGAPWLRANEDAGILDLGPLVLPFESACFTCMALREASTGEHAIEERLYQDALARRRPAGETPPRGEAVATASLGAALVAMEALRVLTGLRPPALVDAVQSVTPLEGSFGLDRLLRVPHCPDCGIATELRARAAAHG